MCIHKTSKLYVVIGFTLVLKKKGLQLITSSQVTSLANFMTTMTSLFRLCNKWLKFCK